jgi:SAM-dependent methyltransferase
MRLIESNIDFRGKRVLDLGCANGFFSYQIARKAKSVTSVDANPNEIEENRKVSKTILAFDNIDFICARITPEFIKTLPEYDIIICLSVFHHILKNSRQYRFGNEAGLDKEQIIDLLQEIKTHTNIFVFEMGAESIWADHGAYIHKVIGCDVREWIPKHVFGPEYKRLIILNGAGYQKWPFNWVPWLAPEARDGLLEHKFRQAGFKLAQAGRKLIRLDKIDRRDFRKIYIGEKKEYQSKAKQSANKRK